jgi:hypothetical protein
VKRFWKRFRPLDLEAELRAGRPEPRPELVSLVAARVRESRGSARTGSFRLAFAGGLTAVMLVAFASVGGLGYAQTAVEEAVEALSGSGSNGLAVYSGSDQYRPGYAWGDPDHNHAGGPELALLSNKVKVRETKSGKYTVVSLRVLLDEQADLYLGVRRSDKRVMLERKGSYLGGALRGPDARRLEYRILIPRAIRVRVKIETKRLKDNRAYSIRLRATDPSGLSSRLSIRFRA